MANELSLLIRLGTRGKADLGEFVRLKKSVGETEKAFAEAQARTAEFARALKAAGGEDAGLKRQFESSRKEAGKLKQSLQDQQVALQKNRNSLRDQGIDVTKLSESWRKLTAAQEKARQTMRESARLASARNIVGLPESRNTEREVQRVQAAFERLRQSGTLSQRELATAALTAKGRIIELRRESGGLIEQLKQVKEQAIALGAAFFAVGRAAFGGAKDLVGFERKLAEIDTLIEDAPGEIKAMGDEIRRQSQRYGKSATDLAQAVYNIISAGVPQGDSLAVLEKSTQAAVAGVADVNETASLGLAVLNSYGYEVDNLDRVFDVLFTTVKNGVTTIPQLGSSLGQVLPTAKSAGVSFEELTASVAQLTQAWGGQTPRAVTALNSAIIQLAAPTPEAKKKLQEIGIEWRGLTDTLRQIRDQNLSVEAIRRIIPDVEGAKAVLTLANNYDQLADKLLAAKNAAGTTAAAFGEIDESRPADLDRFVQVWSEVKRQLGEMLLVLTPAINLVRQLLEQFNKLPDSLQFIIVALTSFLVVGRLFAGVINLGATAVKSLLVSLLPAPSAIITTGNSFRFAATQAHLFAGALGKLKLAANLLLAAFVGWEIGTFLKDEFAEVERFGIALVSGLHTLFVKAKGAIETVWVSLKFVLINPFDALRLRLSQWLTDLSNIVRLVPGIGKDIADGLAKAADFVRPTSKATEEFKKQLADIESSTQKTVQAVQDSYGDLFAAAGNAKSAASGKSGRLPKPARDGLLPDTGAGGSNPFEDGGTLDRTNDLKEEGKRLTEQLRTEQEQLNAELAKYDELRKLNLITEETYNRAVDDANSRLSKRGQLQKEADALILSVQTKQEKYNEEIARYNKLLDEGLISQDTFTRAQEAALKRLQESGKTTFDELKAAALDWGKSVTDTLVEMAATGKASFRDLADAILKDILKILIYQNLIKPTLQYFGVVDAAVQHEGGIAGTGPKRTISAAAFLSAPRYATGGIAGIDPMNEIPAILHKDEEILRRDDPRHRFNGGLNGGQQQNIRVVNAIDKSAIADALATPDGERVVLNIIRRNPGAVRGR